MKKNKKLMLPLIFCLGALIFATTAFADISAKSGYEQLKDSIKYTTKYAAEELENFTVDTTTTLKSNGNLLITSRQINKTDMKNNSSENTSSTEYSNGENDSSYYYNDRTTSINYNSFNDTYYVNEHAEDSYYRAQFEDPFQNENAKDVERIIDALIGNLQDYVVVDEKADGSKEFSGSLSEGQIPTLVNAIASLAVKQSLPNAYYDEERYTIPKITEDIFIKNITGKASVNKDGLIESILASCTISGKDEGGKSHDLTAEALIRITDINSTVLTKPDLTGKKVEKSKRIEAKAFSLSAKYIGKYKNDILVEKDGSYIKVGERFVEINNIDDEYVSGKYYEEYKEEYAAQYDENKIEFTFDAEISGPFSAELKNTDSEGLNIFTISFEPNQPKINLYGNTPPSFDGQFSRVVD